MESLWTKKYHVSMSGPLLAAVLEEKRRLRQTRSGYFRLVVADFSADTPRIWRGEFKETKQTSKALRFQFGLDEDLRQWLDLQAAYLGTDPGNVVRYILHKRLGVSFEATAETDPVIDAAIE